MPDIILRFVEGKAWSSKAIEWREAVSMPITPSHVECVTPDGKYLGQHDDGGMQAREPGYDDGTFSRQFFLSIPVTPEQHDAFYSYVIGSIDEPYDWKAILGFALPLHEHTKFQAICSAKMLLACRKAMIFRWPTAAPAHLVDPRDLLLMLSCVMEVTHTLTKENTECPIRTSSSPALSR